MKFQLKLVRCLGVCLVFLFLSGFHQVCVAQFVYGSCANNNDDPPTFLPPNDPAISVNVIDVTTLGTTNTGNQWCIGDASDPDEETGGCGTFRFTNLP
ncbi:MAG: hypothetical protein OEQ53_16745, partial [Saprospiraceae bacterium]|nr:hypothetical protein [Saprospiraceae bacterium]